MSTFISLINQRKKKQYQLRIYERKYPQKEDVLETSQIAADWCQLKH